MKKIFAFALTLALCVSMLATVASANVSMGGKIVPKDDTVVIIDPEDTPLGVPCEIVTIFGEGVDLSQVVSVELKGMTIHSLGYLQYREDLSGNVEVTFMVPGIEVGERMDVITMVDGKWIVVNGVSAVAGEVTITLNTEWHCVAFAVTIPDEDVPTGGGEESPRTGAETYIWVAAAALVVCALGAGFAFRRSKKS